jgi:hypothetical protein
VSHYKFIVCMYFVNTYKQGDQRASSAAMDSNGDFVVAWHSYSQDGNHWGVFAQRYASTGSVNGSEFKVNTFTTGSQSFLSVGMDSTGDFVITWQDIGTYSGSCGCYLTSHDGNEEGIFGQRYNALGEPQ